MALHPLPVIPNVFRVTFEWSDPNSGTAANVLHFLSSTLSSTTLNTALVANVTAAMWQSATSSSVINTVKIIPLDGVTATASFTAPGTAAWKGTQTGDNTPQSAALISIRTGIRGPRGRGRVYIPYCSELKSGNGGLDGTMRASIASAWNAFEVAMASAGAQLGIASYKHADFNPSATIAAEGFCATQRRRLHRTSA